ncbi:MAG: glycerophosphodiester phosphodiesterase [Saprospiraceae bacterium]|nr:glycerophosphodiester phosphodiesterase [Saprospiraceae bacterium]
MKLLISCLVLILFLFGCQPKQADSVVEIPENFDWQGHRGARGLMPENSIPGFLKALEYPIKTLEMDVVISKDSQVILSHEPWMSASICSKPDGSLVTEEEDKAFKIFQLTYDEIRQFDCGSRGNVRFPEQQSLPTHKPLLSEGVTEVERHCKDYKIALPFYNIEIKSQPEWDNIFTPEPRIFAQLLIDQINRLGIKDRTCIQSFDVRALQAVHEIDETIVTAYLLENADGLEKNMEKLSFKPNIYSPYHALVSANLVEKVHTQKMRIIPWTVNDTITMRGLINMGVDGIITDYPNLISILKN